MATDDELIANSWLQRIRERTPARLLVGRSGSSYQTSTQLDLRQAHAAAVDAVRDELDIETAFEADFRQQCGLFEVATEARSKAEFLLRPDLGRRLSAEAASLIASRCPKDCDLQIVIGDGLSVTAVTAQVPALLPLLLDGAAARRWQVGQTFVVRHCRVGVINQVGELLSPKVVVLLIGERPGLATAESLSAYMAYDPRTGQTDADRNLISNIHARGTKPEVAAVRILETAHAMMTQELSGTRLASRPTASLT